MTQRKQARSSSRSLTVCSIALIVVAIPALVFELSTALAAAPASAASLAVGASSSSAIVGITFLAWLARFAPSILSWVAAFVWGTGGALMMAGFGNGYADSAIEASSLAGESADLVTSVVTGPLVEETAKGVGVAVLILAARRVLERPAQGAVVGVLVGIGFAWGEDIGYYVSALEDGTGSLWESFFARAVLGAYAHAIFTGVLAYALAWAALRTSRAAGAVLVTLGGLVAALALHAQANGLGIIAPEDSWSLTFGSVELPVLAISVALLAWGLRRKRATLGA